MHVYRRLFLPLIALSAAGAAPPLRLSVYATAGDVQRYLAAPEGVARVEAAMRRLNVSRIFLEGRRGDEYVAPEMLRALRRRFESDGFAVAGGIATVPGNAFGTRQNTKLGWLNWESEKTKADVAQFFRENAVVFDEVIVDDFFCTGDTSAESERARGGRSWARYRQELLAGLVKPLMAGPARSANARVRLTLKFPQWYDRFQLFGYDPVGMSGAFERVWVGTEVRNPRTPRMGYVQPVEGYMNFRWLAAVLGGKVEGAWFDHIECTAQNFVDQAYQSVLAGARELTLFHLGDLVEGHPGHALLAAALPELADTAGRVSGRAAEGIAFYKPPGSDADENLYLMDYLGMLGLPVVPEARYPAQARAVVLGVQAAADAGLVGKVKAHLERGATVVVTPALLRKAGAEMAALAGVRAAAEAAPGLASEAECEGRRVPLPVPLEIDLGMEAPPGAWRAAALARGRRLPLLTARRVGRGQVLAWNVRTFSEQDFRDTGEWLLAPKPLGLPEMPRVLADALRRELLAAVGVSLSAPAGVAFYQIGGERYLYNFRSEDVEAQLDGRAVQLGANRLARR